ncbi:hypothetical protein FACS1894199_17570 [Bacteroidia bacterium]|nr:hypothetical protein FACS1894199_17570 [Bacteroidia bacterium]
MRFLKEMSKETDYQYSGNVNDNQLAKLGKYFGVEYVCVADIMTSYGSKFLATRLINVETAMILATSEEELSAEDTPSIIKLTDKVAIQLLENAIADDKAKADAAKAKADSIKYVEDSYNRRVDRAKQHASDVHSGGGIALGIGIPVTIVGGIVLAYNTDDVAMIIAGGAILVSGVVFDILGIWGLSRDYTDYLTFHMPLNKTHKATITPMPILSTQYTGIGVSVRF